jgi:hypothetical protein
MEESPKVLLHANPNGILTAIAILIAAFVLGYGISWVSARRMGESNFELQQKLRLAEQKFRLAELRGTLGMMTHETNRNNYAEAAKYSTEFFNGLRKTINETSDQALIQQLESMIGRRDEITTNLAQADPAVKEKLAQMYIDFFQTTATL